MADLPEVTPEFVAELKEAAADAIRVDGGDRPENWWTAEELADQMGGEVTATDVFIERASPLTILALLSALEAAQVDVARLAAVEANLHPTSSAPCLDDKGRQIGAKWWGDRKDGGYKTIYDLADALLAQEKPEVTP